MLLIANPISGHGRSLQQAQRCAEHLRQLGRHAELHVTTAAGDATARALASQPQGFDTLVACGGDGTVNEVLAGLGDQALAMLPSGTANVLANELHLPRDAQQVAQMIATGKLRHIAKGLANARPFLLFCGVGVDGAVVHRLAATRQGTLGKHRWAAPIWQQLWHWPQFDLSAQFADGTCLSGLSSVLVTRVRDYGGVVRLPADIDVQARQLFALCFTARARRSWFWLGLRGAFGKLRAGPHLRVVPTTALRILGTAPCQVDGDATGCSPLAVTLANESLRLLVP